MVECVAIEDITKCKFFRKKYILFLKIINTMFLLSKNPLFYKQNKKSIIEF